MRVKGAHCLVASMAEAYPWAGGELKRGNTLGISSSHNILWTAQGHFSQLHRGGDPWNASEVHDKPSGMTEAFPHTTSYSFYWTLTGYKAAKNHTQGGRDGPSPYQQSTEEAGVVWRQFYKGGWHYPSSSKWGLVEFCIAWDILEFLQNGKEKTLSPYWLTNCQLEDRTLAVIFIVNLYSVIYYKLNYTGLPGTSRVQ